MLPLSFSWECINLQTLLGVEGCRREDSFQFIYFTEAIIFLNYIVVFTSTIVTEIHPFYWIRFGIFVHSRIHFQSLLLGIFPFLQGWSSSSAQSLVGVSQRCHNISKISLRGGDMKYVSEPAKNIFSVWIWILEDFMRNPHKPSPLRSLIWFLPIVGRITWRSFISYFPLCPSSLTCSLILLSLSVLSVPIGKISSVSPGENQKNSSQTVEIRTKWTSPHLFPL